MEHKNILHKTQNNLYNIFSQGQKKYAHNSQTIHIVILTDKYNRSSVVAFTVCDMTEKFILTFIESITRPGTHIKMCKWSKYTTVLMTCQVISDA